MLRVCTRLCTAPAAAAARRLFPTTFSTTSSSSATAAAAAPAATARQSNDSSSTSFPLPPGHDGPRILSEEVRDKMVALRAQNPEHWTDLRLAARFGLGRPERAAAVLRLQQYRGEFDKAVAELQSKPKNESEAAVEAEASEAGDESKKKAAAAAADPRSFYERMVGIFGYYTPPAMVGERDTSGLARAEQQVAAAIDAAKQLMSSASLPRFESEREDVAIARELFGGEKKQKEAKVAATGRRASVVTKYAGGVETVKTAADPAKLNPTHARKRLIFVDTSRDAGHATEVAHVSVAEEGVLRPATAEEVAAVARQSNVLRRHRRL